MTNPRVSVVLPYFNTARFLAEAIESVRAQTFTHWELLLCDDGSTDASAEIAQRYAALDPDRIRCFAHPDGLNHGSSAARNLGFRHARGEFIALLDADDVYLSRKLEAQLEILDARPDADAVYGPTRLWHGWTGVAADAARDETLAMGFPSNTLLGRGQLLVGALRRETQMPSTCAILLRAEVVRRIGGFADEFPAMYDDQAFFAKLSLGASLLFIDQWWDLYRRHPSSMYAMAKADGSSDTSRLEYLIWLERRLAHDPAGNDATLRAALRAALRRARHPRVFALIDRARAALRLPSAARLS